VRLLRRALRSAMRPSWLAAVAWTLLLGSCAGVLTGDAGRVTASAASDPPRRPGMPLVVVAMPDSPAFQTVRRTLVSELAKDFDVSTHLIDSKTTDGQFRDDLEDSGASAVVLMDNRTIKLYRAYQAGHAAGTAFIPAVVTMSSFLEELHPQLPGSSGVAYEVPGVIAFVRLRDIVKTPVRRVGVIHRPVFHDFIERQKTLAAKEQIELVPIAVSANPDPKEVQAALRRLKTGPPIDALWILNDNRLLPSGEFLETAWRAGADALDVPVIVGIAALVSEEAHLGTFAVVPDLDALGVQTANLVFELSDRHWKADGLPVELPVSTVTVGNLRQLRQRFGLRDGALQRIDRTVE
jgi:hypothetical protein